MGKIKQFFHRFIVQSHRGAHLIVGFLVGLFFGADAAACVGLAFEVKDVQGDRYNAQYGTRFWQWRWTCFDWVDFGLTVAGGLLGGLVRLWLIGRFM